MTATRFLGPGEVQARAWAPGSWRRWGMWSWLLGAGGGRKGTGRPWGRLRDTGMLELPSFSPSGCLGMGQVPLVLLLFSFTLFAGLLVAILVQGQWKALRSGASRVGAFDYGHNLGWERGTIPEGGGAESQNSSPVGFPSQLSGGLFHSPSHCWCRGRGGEGQRDEFWLHPSSWCGLLWTSKFLILSQD